MKKIIILLSTITLTNCSNYVGENNPKVNSNGIMYFKDTTTNLCFAKIESQTYCGFLVSNITCVPCDSLKKIGLK